MSKESFVADIGTALIEGVVFLSFTGLFTWTVITFGAIAFSLWN